MTKHTPGPWKTSNMAPGIVYAETGGKRDELVCTAYRRDNDEHNANARLIASAPDLLSALEMAVATIERIAPKHGPFSSVDGTLSVASAAIAKAEGRR